MEAYLDNSATTRVDAQVQELMKKLMDVDFGNPSSRFIAGNVIEKAERIEAWMGDNPENERMPILPVWIHRCLIRSQRMRLFYV